MPQLLFQPDSIDGYEFNPIPIDIHLGIIVFVITCSALVILSNFINKYPHHKVKNYNRAIDRTHSNVALTSIASVIKKA